MMDTVTRWKIDHETADIYPHESGEYVDYEDYLDLLDRAKIAAKREAELAARVAKLEQERDEALALTSVARSY